MVASINKPLAIDSNILMFSDRDLEDVNLPHVDALFIKIQISNALVNHIPVNNCYPSFLRAKVLLEIKELKKTIKSQ